MRKKSQIMGQVFILILASMIFILILLYGYKAIANFTQRSEQVAAIEFQTELESAVKAITLSFGSVKKVELSPPSKTQQVCFVTDAGQDFREQYPILYDAWLSGTQNVFLVPLSETTIFLENIEVAKGWLCSDVRNKKLVLRLEGLGNRARISEWA